MTRKNPVKPKSIIEDERFLNGELSNGDIHKMVADDETKRYHLQIVPGSPLTSYTSTGVTFDFRTRPVDPITKERDIHHGHIQDLSPRLVEVLEYNLARQVVTVFYERDVKAKTTNPDVRRFVQVECYKSRPAALKRIMKEPRVFHPEFKGPVGVRELMSDWVRITETDAESPNKSMILLLQNEKQRQELVELRAKLASKDEK